ncbi:MAG: chemotaxis protein CheW [Labilithrix sp.]|nr:chemotaxis protein CheW [Labilithrix sp.]MBX3223855.1 chemotaxis protein CheW [Labilithrix sp.]
MSDERGGARPTELGGVVFRVGDELFFLPASIAMKVSPVPEIARVPGGPLELRGVALVGGVMIPVVDVLEDPWAEPGGAMLVCAVLGESVGLVGIDVLATGRFEAGDRPDEVRFGERTARTFDLASAIARVREGRWAV